MAREFLPVDRDQQCLMPPAVQDWVPEGHPVRFVVDVVEQVLDLSAFVARHPLGGVGRRAYHPSVMVGLLLWAYANGVFSSREIERRCETDVAFMFVAASYVPDHGTIARFRASMADELKALHAQVLAMCADLGLVQLGLVALDGTKLAGNASKDANRSRTWIEEQIAEWFKTAERTDVADDDLFGSARGDEVPEGLKDPTERLARLRRAHEQVMARQAAADRRAPKQQPDEPTGGDTNPPAPNAKAAKDKPPKAPKANVTDPDSGLMPLRGGGFVQGYNAQAVATTTGVVLATGVTSSPGDVGEFVPMMTALAQSLHAAGLQQTTVGCVVADAGYWSETNATADVAAGEVLIATDRSPKTCAAKAAEGLSSPGPPALDREDHQRRCDVIGAWVAGDIDYRRAAALLGLSIPRVYELGNRYQALGPDGLQPRRAPNGTGRRPKPPSSAQQAKHAMRLKLTSEQGQADYRQRAPTIEGVFGNTKHNQGFRRLSRRGLIATQAEWAFFHTAGNLTKARRATHALLGALNPRPA